MKSDNFLRHLLMAFGLAVLIYILFYSVINYRRTHNGPWSVAFTNSAGTSVMLVNQPKIGITNLQILFVGQTNQQTGSFEFSQARAVPFDVPFGKCVFMDPTFLPGTIAFDVFGHEIQLMPRTLTIDGKEMPWRSDTVIPLVKTNAP